MSGSGFFFFPRGNVLEALSGLIADFKRGYISQAKIANKNGIDRRTLRSALRKGEKLGSGPLYELHLAELSSRDRRPWGCRSGAGRPFPKPSARTLAERAAERWWDLEPPFRTSDDDTESGDGGDSGVSSTQYPRERDADFHDLVGGDQGYEEPLRSSTHSSAVKGPGDKSTSRGPG